MKQRILQLTLLLFVFLLHQKAHAQGNNFIVISGKIIDEGNFFESYTLVSNLGYDHITENKHADVFVTSFNKQHLKLAKQTFSIKTTCSMPAGQHWELCTTLL